MQEAGNCLYAANVGCRRIIKGIIPPVKQRLSLQVGIFLERLGEIAQLFGLREPVAAYEREIVVTVKEMVYKKCLADATATRKKCEQN